MIPFLFTMMLPKRYLAAVLLFCFLTASSHAQKLVVCGWDEVFILDTRNPSDKTWTWRARQSPEIPEDLWDHFLTTDECKPIEQGQKILISSSGGGAAVVDRSSLSALWHASVPNAHSIEWLPGEQITVAASTAELGNRIVLFDLSRRNEPLFWLPLYSAHGVYWDPPRQLLWAIGYDRLLSHKLAPSGEGGLPPFWGPGEYQLPDPGGHDLAPHPDGQSLIVTTDQHVYLFDRELASFQLHPFLGNLPRVKSVSVNPVTGQVAVIQAEGEDWWATRILFFEPSSEIVLPGEHLYKARWLIEQTD